MTADPRRTEHYRELDAAHHLHPFSDMEALNRQGSRVMVRGEGIHVWDSDGVRLIDGMAGLWCVNLGYGRRDLAEAAYAQLCELPYYNTFFKTTHPRVAELSALVAEVAPPGFSHVFYTNSGSEAVDTMMRMVRHYWALKGQPQKKVLIGRWNGYHGSTLGGASLGGMPAMHAQGDLPVADVVHVEQPWFLKHGLDGETEEAFGLRAARWVEEKILETGADRVAAFVGEPIQGAGGVIIPPASYWLEVERICRRHDVLLVADEVICGFGRTGEWFGHQLYGIRPDLFTVAKGLSSGYLPIGGVVVGDEVAQVIKAGGDFNHGFTYSGHPACAAVAAANVRALRDEGVVERVRQDTGPYMQQRWREAFGGFAHLADIRGVGLIQGFTWVQDKELRRLFPDWGEVGLLCRDVFFRHNLIMRACGDHMVAAPPLVINRDEVDAMLEVAVQCVAETESVLRERGLID